MVAGTSGLGGDDSSANDHKGGTDLAVNGVIATNLIQNSAIADVTSSTLTATGANAPDGTAALWIDAETRRTSPRRHKRRRRRRRSSGGGNATSVGLVLAFNTIGYDASNVLFNAVDALFGNALLGDAKRTSATASRI